MAYKILPGFEKYVIFDDGRIWSKSKHLFMSPCPNGDGYPTTLFNRKSKAFHILIATAFVPNPDGHKEVNHIDGIKTNNHYKNLEWCTRGHNIKHCYKLGLRTSEGARIASAKLDVTKVKCIRFLYEKCGYTQSVISEFYKVSQSQISSIISGKSWAHV